MEQVEYIEADFLWMLFLSPTLSRFQYFLKVRHGFSEKTENEHLHLDDDDVTQSVYDVQQKSQIHT